MPHMCVQGNRGAEEIRSGCIVRVTDARSIACTGTTNLYGPPPRRHHPPGAPYELAETVQTTGATSDCIMNSQTKMSNIVEEPNKVFLVLRSRDDKNFANPSEH